MSAGDATPRTAAKGRNPFRLALIVLAIVVGLVVLIGLPSYGDYTHRAQVSEAVALLGAAKTPLAEYFTDNRKWPDDLKLVVGVEGKYTQSVTVTKGAGGTGEIELTAVMRSDKVDRRVAGKSVRLTSSDGGRTWTCRTGTLPQNVLPQSCRQEK
jgi:type IV pilus assembly protein PilA